MNENWINWNLENPETDLFNLSHQKISAHVLLSVEGKWTAYQNQNNAILSHSKTCPFSTFKEIDMAENEAMELQAMLPGGQVTSDASSVPVSSQQASESTESIIVQIEQEEDGKSSCMR